MTDTQHVFPIHVAFATIKRRRLHGAFVATIAAAIVIALGWYIAWREMISTETFTITASIVGAILGLVWLNFLITRHSIRKGTYGSTPFEIRDLCDTVEELERKGEIPPQKMRRSRR